MTYQKDEGEAEAIPYTFEDSLALSNLALFRGYDNPKGLLIKFQEALRSETLEDAGRAMFRSLEGGKKAEMALELLFLSDPRQVEPPGYVADGLEWLEQKLLEKKKDTISMGSKEVGDA